MNSCHSRIISENLSLGFKPATQIRVTTTATYIKVSPHFIFLIIFLLIVHDKMLYKGLITFILFIIKSRRSEQFIGCSELCCCGNKHSVRYLVNESATNEEILNHQNDSKTSNCSKAQATNKQPMYKLKKKEIKN